MTSPRASLAACFVSLLILLATSTSVMAVVPSAPTNVDASNGLWAGWVRVEWDTTHTAGFHNVYRANSAFGTYTKLDHVEHPITYYNDTSAATGQTHYYKVKTCIDITCSDLSGYDSGWRGYLNTVTSVSATEGDPGGVYVVFSPVANADYYKVLRATSVGGSKTLVGSPTGTTFLDDQATPNTTYYYWVVACNNTDINQCGQAYVYDTGSRAWPDVQNVAASDGGHAHFVRVTWDAVSGAVGYRVDRGYPGTESLWIDHEMAGDTTSYDYYLPLSSVATDYKFAVRSCFDIGCSSFRSTPDVGWMDYPPPANVSATEGYTTHTVVTWDEVHSDAWHYVFRDETNSPNGKELAGISGVAQTFNDTPSQGALPGTDYKYWVVACPYTASDAFDKGCSAYSLSDRGYYLPVVPVIDASDGTSPSHVEINWQAIDGAATYVVERSEDPSAEPPVWTVLDTVGTNSYLDASAVEGVTYWYSARACGADYCGGDGATDSGYVQSTEICNVKTVSGATEYFFVEHDACEFLVLGPDFTATAGSDVSLSSGWEISFVPEFTVEEGATLEAKVCGRSLCEPTMSMMPDDCHPCVTQICDIYPDCCGGTVWDQSCVDKVDTVCGLVCE